MYTHETGMQFCRFECTEEVSSVKKSSLKIVDYALMLPYSRRGFPFQKQFTLVYSDWEVTGMQFCRFECTEEVSSVKKSSLKIVDYALMLPYSRRGFPFQKQFTLVYSDWEVLLCDNDAPIGNKGPVYVHRPLFDDVLSQS